MTGHLNERDRARMSRGGYIPMSSAHGLAGFDAALRQARSFVVPAQFDLATIRSRSAVGGLPPMFRGLIHAARRTVEPAAIVEPSADLRQRLAAMSPSEREHELLDIVRSNAAAVLGHDSGDTVGADQDFKELGFDSLGAVEFRNRLKSATGLKLPTTAVLDHPTSMALARYLARALDTHEPSDPGEEVDGRVQQESWPLTAYQRDIVAIGARYPDLPVAQVVVYARLDGTVNLERMRECVRRAYLRNDALRLRFEFRDSEFVQQVGTEPPELESVDFTGDADPAAACRRWIDEASERVLPLDGPLTRAAVLVDRTDSFLVYACFHHSVADAWGINLALSQMLTEYVSEADTSSDNDVEAPRYVDFVRAEREYRASPEWAADREYFVETYRDVEPALFARSGSVGSRRRRHHTLRVNPGTAQRVRDTGRSIFAFTAAGIGEYLRRIHRGRDIIIGVPFLNRSSDAELRTVGCMVNMLPLRIPVDGALSMVELADQISAQVWELQARQRFAYGDIVTALQDSAGTFSTLFDVTYSCPTIPDIEDAEWIWKDSSLRSSGYSLDAVNIVVRDNEWDGSLEVDLFYADDVFDANYRFEDALRHVLDLDQESTGHAEMSLGEIEHVVGRGSPPARGLRSPTEGRLMLDTAQNVSIDRVAAGVPGQRPAVMSAGGTLCYAEFNAAADHIAEVLRAKGVERDECVAVIVPRSPELLVAIHGILRAGAAYVPIDNAAYPAIRIRTIIEESGARVIVAGNKFAEMADELGVDHVEPSIAGADPVEPVASPDDLAYVIYTSGSTGRPKGVMIERRSVVEPAALDAAAVSTRCR